MPNRLRGCRYLNHGEVSDDYLNYWHEKAISELNNIADAYFLRAYRKEQHENVPLTWDELKLMEGFPVWVEGSHGPALSYKGWALISFDRQGDDMKCQLYNSSEFWIGEEDYGTDWQAYMKEREATGGILTCEPKLKKIGDDTEIKWSENDVSRNND